MGFSDGLWLAKKFLQANLWFVKLQAGDAVPEFTEQVEVMG